MTFEEFFHGYWWLMFPIFGMFIALIGMFQAEGRSRKVMELIKAYVDQGKEPPPELLKMARDPSDYDMSFHAPKPRHSNAWSFVVFLALAAGFAVGFWFVQGESYAFAFAIVAVTMGVMALGALLLLILGRK